MNMKTFEVAAKKSKRKNRVKTILLSIVTGFLLLVVAWKGLAWITSRNANEVREYHQTMTEISYPNVSYINWSFIADSEFTGTYYADQVKDIAGITVPFEDFEEHYGLYRGYGRNQHLNLYKSSDSKGGYTHGNSYKVPLFYNTNRHYQQMGNIVTQDISLLSQMPNRVVEMAVTFDKSYTFDEIQAMIPSNLNINWYWIGSNSSYDTSELKLNAQIGFQPNLAQLETYEEMKKQEKPANLSKEEAQKAYEDYQKKLADLTPSQGFRNSYTFFQAHLEKALANHWLGYSVGADGKDYDLTTDVKDYLKKNQDGKTATFAGVILTGKAEDFTQLEKSSWIFASNIGQDVEVKPYHHLNAHR
ncbi:anti sigma factor C-terminal domain-containing protein [Streptococcus sp. ZJ93]|uniref:anti sigma factor C-terminal domain-containing protein n=1 Tax=Streptococcus handemini TaxID=3161188 RepID=UPI0032EECB35